MGSAHLLESCAWLYSCQDAVDEGVLSLVIIRFGSPLDDSLSTIVRALLSSRLGPPSSVAV